LSSSGLPSGRRRASQKQSLPLDESGRAPMDIFVLLATMLVSFAIGMPIAYALALSAIAGALWIGIPLEAVMLQISNGVSKVAMLTIPFFVLAGAIMAEGGMARRLVAFADVLVGFTRVRGGLSVVNVVATTFLSGISGSAVADTSAIGSVMIPQMEKSGFPRVFATNVTIASSVQALLVPPSHNAVIYSLATGGTISIISLFMAGVVPGLLLGVALVILCLGIAYRDCHPRGKTVPLSDAVKITIEALWGLVTLGIILGGILFGVFTAIEAGAVACVWAFFVTMVVYRDYRWRDLPALIHRTVRTVAMVLTLIACASSVGYIMALTQMPAKITAAFLAVSSNKYVILMLVNVMLLVLGCLVDMAPSILISTPILLPVMIKLGVDPVHFGMIMMLNLGIGLCHPPVGAILFVGCAVGEVTIEQVLRRIWPFYAVMFIVLILVTYLPALSLWLPHLLGL
jgi:tripartite ATP-independent transporter DctM subunit